MFFIVVLSCYVLIFLMGFWRNGSEDDKVENYKQVLHFWLWDKLVGRKWEENGKKNEKVGFGAGSWKEKREIEGERERAKEKKKE